MDEEPSPPASPVRALVLGVLGVVSAIFVVGALAGREEAVARADDAHDLRRRLDQLARPVRTAWLVRQEGAGTLVVVDALGGETRFVHRADRLEVVRPDGRQGVLLSGIDRFELDTRLVRRLREAAPLQRVSTVWDRPFDGEPRAMELAVGDHLALAFHVPAEAPASVGRVAGLPEQFLGTRPARVRLPLRRTVAGPTAVAVRLSLHEASVRDDARPRSRPLASCRVALPELPAASTDRRDLVAVDLAALRPDAPLRPGVPYTLVVEPLGAGLTVMGLPAGTQRSGVSLRNGDEGAWQELPLQVPGRLEGPSRFTQTVAHEVIEQVDLSLALRDGRSAELSLAVAGQVAAGDAWLGAVPGELPVLAGETPDEPPRSSTLPRPEAGR